MTTSWKTCSDELKDFVYDIQKKIKEMIGDKRIGIYLHGSLAMGGFNPNKSDIDVLVVTNEPLSIEKKRVLAKYLLNISTSPYPVEISVLNKKQVINWQHPCPFDFHYSEFWRRRYEEDLINDTPLYLNGEIITDPDLAAHITIINHRGICLEGESIERMFPSVPKSDYLSSILGDFNDCLNNIEDDPVYCCLNLLRVYWYVKDGVISSKLEAGQWGMVNLPEGFRDTIREVVDCYLGDYEIKIASKEEFHEFRNFVQEKVNQHLPL